MLHYTEAQQLACGRLAAGGTVGRCAASVTCVGHIRPNSSHSMTAIHAFRVYLDLEQRTPT